MSAHAQGAPRPEPVFCVIDGAYRSLEIAEDVLCGRFTAAGSTHSVGLPPDWQDAELPADPEWAIEWRKFYYGLDLAHAYGVRGEPRFLDAWEALLASFLACGAPLSDASDVIGRRIQNWIYAWQRFAAREAFPGLRPGLAERLLEAIDAQVAHLRAHLTPERNHRTLELYALMVAALAFPKRRGAAALRDFALHALEENLLADVLPDGVHREASTHYHMTTLRTYLGLRENARLHGLEVSAAFDARLLRAVEFALFAHAPDGTIPALSDADVGDYRDLLALAARIFQRPDFAFVATGGHEGARPGAQLGHFPLGGYFFQRSAWQERERFSSARWGVFDCGPLGCGGHGHYDALSVELYAHGRRLLVDPGRYTYHEGAPGTPNWRAWFKGTAAHNTVCVDGLDQTPYRRGRHRGPRAEARLLARASGPGLDLLAGEVKSPCYEAIHRRSLLFVGDEYWLIEDVLCGQERHVYDLRFHLAPEAHGRCRLGRTHTGWELEAPGLRLGLAVATRPVIEPGFVAPSYGERVAAPVVSVRQCADAARFVTLVAPVAPAEHAWSLVSLGAENGVRWVELAARSADGFLHERVSWADAPSPLALPERTLRARAARVRTDAAGRVLAFAAVGVDAVEDGTALDFAAGGALWHAPDGTLRSAPAEAVR